MKSEREAAVGANIMARPLISMFDQDTSTDDEGHDILGIV